VNEEKRLPMLANKEYLAHFFFILNIDKFKKIYSFEF